MDPLALLAGLCVLGAIVLGLIGLQQATASPRASMERRLGRVIGESTGMEAATLNVEGLRRRRAGNIPVIGLFLEGRSWTQDTALALERGDIKLTVSEYVALRLFLAFLGAALPFLLIHDPLVMVVMAAGAVFGFVLPALWVGHAQKSRIGKLDSQLPDTLTMLSNSLKAGFGLMQSMDLASRELAHPIATELRRTLQDINVGAATEDALQALGKRSGSQDLDIVVTAMLIQQTTGGNLAEILDNVAHTMRERIRIRGEIKTLTMQQVMTGFIVGGLPLFIGAVVSVLNPSYMDPLLTTLPGHLMLGGALVLEAFGIMVIKKILAIEV
jgi:tight adherence protein B